MTVSVYEGDCRLVLKTLPEKSVQCCITSPPYFGLRDYGVESQIGLESTPDAFVSELVDVFREVRRVLRDDGTLWLNLGDSYARSLDKGGSGPGKNADYSDQFGLAASARSGSSDGAVGRADRPGTRNLAPGLKPKDLIGIPWLVAFALRADGWFLRSDIIWHKPNPMPESVTDRPTKAHEYLFLLSKSPTYYYDADAIAETGAGRELFGNSRAPSKAINADRKDSSRRDMTISGSRNRRSVWTVATHAYPGSHFATFPPKLIDPCVLAGSRVAGKRCDCDQVIATPTGTVEAGDPTMTTGRKGMNRPRGEFEGTAPITRREQRHHAREMRESSHREDMAAECGAAFDHYIRTDLSGARPLPPAIRQAWLVKGWITDAPPCDCPVAPADVILDPFGGAGTTGLVADRRGRNAILIELNPEYAALARRRIEEDAPLFSSVESL